MAATLWCSVEDSAVILGPPRMGKGLHLVIPWVLDAPGPVVTTSTRPDTLAVTLDARAARPGRSRSSTRNASPGCPAVCAGPRSAAARPRAPRWSGPAAWPPEPAGAAAPCPTREFWSGQTEAALRCLLHAAALGRPARRRPVPVVAEPGRRRGRRHHPHQPPRRRPRLGRRPGRRRSTPTPAPATASGSASAKPSPPSPTPTSWTPSTPHPGRRSTRPRSCATPAPSTCSPPPSPPAACAPLVAAFVEDITETARALAARSPARPPGPAAAARPGRDRQPHPAARPCPR